MKTNVKRWAVIFRCLANVNRLKIIAMLFSGQAMNVGEITADLGISFKATSNHLAILKNLNVLESQGIADHVLYVIHSELAPDFHRAINLLLK